jgi:DNA-binding NarL/FixJ family response regulator
VFLHLQAQNLEIYQGGDYQGGSEVNIRLPVRVGLMDDDFFALKWNADLLTRDLRTTICFEAETPADLCRELSSWDNVDILLLDVEYYPDDPCLPELIRSIQSIRPRTKVVCLSQYGEFESLQAAIQCETGGFLLKRDVRMGIVSALVLAVQVDFLITPGVIPILQQDHKQLIEQFTKINAWVPHPCLTPQLRQVLTLRILYGMSAPMAAQEIHLAPSTVEKYMQYIYQRLNIQWGDDEYLAGLELNDLPPDVQAFHRFNLPPKESQVRP